MFELSWKPSPTLQKILCTKKGEKKQLNTKKEYNLSRSLKIGDKLWDTYALISQKNKNIYQQSPRLPSANTKPDEAIEKYTWWIKISCFRSNLNTQNGNDQP